MSLSQRRVCRQDWGARKAVPADVRPLAKVQRWNTDSWFLGQEESHLKVEQ